MIRVETGVSMSRTIDAVFEFISNFEKNPGEQRAILPTQHCAHSGADR